MRRLTRTSSGVSAPRLSQLHGFLVLTAEFKMNLLAPASGDSLVAEGQVVRAGRTLTVCRGDAFTEGVERVHVATMLATIIGRPAPSAEAV
jgi:acyl-coenzyme A thioesterase PaaI-like protein